MLSYEILGAFFVGIIVGILLYSLAQDEAEEPVRSTPRVLTRGADNTAAAVSTRHSRGGVFSSPAR